MPRAEQGPGSPANRRVRPPQGRQEQPQGWAPRSGGASSSWLPPEGQLAALQLPQQAGPAAAGVLRHQLAPVLEQALAVDLKQGGTADGEAPAEGFGGQPDRVVHGGSGGGGCLGQRGRLPKVGGGRGHSARRPLILLGYCFLKMKYLYRSICGLQKSCAKNHPPDVNPKSARATLRPVACKVKFE